MIDKNNIPVGAEVYIVNKFNNMVFTVSEGQYNTKKGEIIAETNQKFYSQKFVVLEKNKAQNFYYIQSTSLKMVVQIKRGKTEEHLQATLDKYDGDTNQLWRIFPSHISWNQQGKTLKAKNPSTMGYDYEQKTKQIVSKMGYSNQKKQQNEGYFYIQNLKTEQVLQIQGGIDAQGMNIVQNKNYGNRNQKWRFVLTNTN